MYNVLTEVSSLDKIRSFADLSSPVKRFTLLGGEHYAYQIAVSGSDAIFDVKVVSPLEKYIKLYAVKSVPMDRPCYIGSQDSDLFISRTPCLMPDLLEPLEYSNNMLKHYDVISAVWVDITLPKGFPAGEYPIKVEFTSLNIKWHSSPDEAKTSLVTATVLPYSIPERTTLFTQWFHTDSIASYYNVPVYSDRHWELIDKFMAEAAHDGINMILTPVIAPPLDTCPGMHRPLTQLVRITKEDEKYSFDFSLLGRWIALCKKNNIPHLEISHLFSQWGLEFTPSIWVNDSYLFDWGVKSDDPSYKSFLEQFLPQLREYLKAEDMYDGAYFHISDEPQSDHLEAYANAKRLIKSILPDCRIMDALSHADFLDGDVMDIPVPSLDAVESFLARDISERWVYYCCGAGRRSNRYISMQSARTRILGLQMYKYGIKGFLHWGYNFYYSGLSMYKINPFVTTSADKFFPSGDPFSVYPGADGPLPSLRALVFSDAFSDIEPCRLLEKKIGKEAVLAAIDSVLGYELTFDNYPKAAHVIPEITEKLKSML